MGFCHWWYIDEHWQTECQRDGERSTMTAIDQQAAEWVFRAGAEFCPFCGEEWSEIGLDEVVGEESAEAEYRNGIRYGVGGY